MFFHASLLPVPEVVPFRLTQNLVDGLGCLKQHGSYREHCIKTQTWIRSHDSILFSVFNCLIYDPIDDFNLSNNANFNKEKSNTQAVEKKGSYHSKAQEQIFLSLERKISGKIGQFGEPSLTVLSVEGQVDMVIGEATSSANLCRMFSGWSPWL